MLVDGVRLLSTTSTYATLTGLQPSTPYAITLVAVAQSGQQSAPSIPAFVTTLEIDRTPLTTSASVSPAVPDGMNGWYVTTPTVTLASSPSTVTATTYYSWNSSSGPWTSYTGSFAPIDGSNTLYYYSHDDSDQRADETPKSTAVKLDPLVPAATQMLTAQSVTHNSVTLSWLPVIEPFSGIDHYEVWDDYVGSTVGTQFTVGGLTPLTTYPFSIVTVNGAGVRSSSSSTVTVETSNTPLPAAPASVLAGASGGGSVFVDWSPSTDVVGTPTYWVWRSTDGVNYSRVASVSPTPNTSYLDTGLRSSTRYYYAVSTVDSRGESPLSDTSAGVWPHTAPFTGRPDRPTGLATVPGSDSVLVTWAASTNPATTGYVVRRTPSSLSSDVTTLSVSSVTFPPSLTDASAVNGQVYYYSVCAVDASGTIGSPSLEITATPRAAYTGPDIHLVDFSGGSTNTCWTCHSVHGSPQVKAGARSPLAYTTPGYNEDPLCLSCHSVGSGRSAMDTQSQITDPLAKSVHSVYTTATPGASATCDTCHRPVSNVGGNTAALLGNGGVPDAVKGGDAFCYQCHGAGSTLPYGDMTGFENSGHVNVASPATGSGVKCIACHEPHASRNTSLTTYSGYMVCTQCHSASAANPNTPDILSQFTLNPDSNSKHPILPADQAGGAAMSCQNCHNTHATSKTEPLVDPHDPGPSGQWTGSSSNQKSFCFTCHDGTPLPTAAETQPWAGAVTGQGGATTVADIKDAYATNVHGFGAHSITTTATAFLRPDMGYGVDTVLDCNACHEPHGTINNYALKQNVTSADKSTTASGLLVYKIPAGSITPTSPVGYDVRFFCSSCHLFDPATHDPIAHTDTTQFGKTDCLSCHRHIKNGTPSTNL